ncbi:bifunctional transcriptional activator/DNA repair enzyme AdaA [Halpernia frigidisoli]|uniref:Methylated-DNA--protein-cysteine methyltransferase n=1 Tax=Halpernia frigidisoli TaxID=1125876 RepID=A0A1I3DGA3_9FLAO|nr:bifunctional transcriptional activator/DNA repair protein Ada [Halpernia frigidisoli]SFH85755.1 AraC family transcriptional regulator, regulatory protein of adaptative response / methylated-DNA-[protein]-cysteine methyltransferase [Halpernia frigidisoli]
MKLTDEIMYQASLDKNPDFLGVYWMAVKTTGIFCLPTCTARKPKKENVEFFESSKEALDKGFRPCKICKPLENSDSTPPEIQKLLEEISENCELKLKDSDLIERGLQPTKIRRWFLKNHGMTFQAFQRQLHLNKAFKKIQEGENIMETVFNSGFESLSGFNESFKKVFGNSPSNSKSQNIIDLKRIETPLGIMYATASKDGICMLEFADRKSLEKEFLDLAKAFNGKIIIGENPYFKTLEKELKLYFEGKLKEFTIPLSPVGTEFQKSVWEVLRKIPYGEIWTYKKQAEHLGDIKKVRAVANANGLNKISIIIPCHRVIGSNGTLTGYGGGIWRKQKLLELEKSILF